MTKQEKIEVQDSANPKGLALLRQPFPPHQISKLPKPTKRQTEEVRADYKKGIRCEICGQWHHPKVVHLDYVGHAALTDRLLDCDPEWNWEPIAKTEYGTPLLDDNGGMWIYLTVCGVTRMGYGHPDGKRGGDAVKEVIGDALRNAAMRFGAALDLWHKGDLHAQEDAGDDGNDAAKFDASAASKRINRKLEGATDLADLRDRWQQEQDTIANIKAVNADLYVEISRTKDARKATLESAHNNAPPAPQDDLGGDGIPY